MFLTHRGTKNMRITAMKTKIYSINLILIAMLFCGTSVSFVSAEDFNRLDVRPGYSVDKAEVVEPSPMEDYVAKSRKKIKNNWYPPAASFENRASIAVTIDKEGQLVDCVMTESSNDEEFDKSLINAVKKAKFSPLPREVKDDKVTIDFTFNMQRRTITKE